MKTSRDISIVLVLCNGMMLFLLSCSTEETPQEGSAPQLMLPIGHMENVTSVVFCPDGRYALSESADTTLKLWEVATGREIRAFAGHTSFVHSVAISLDGRYALSGAYRTVELWDIATGGEVRIFAGHTRSVNSVVFTGIMQV
ncbi:WD40 repeat domain-containing protein [Candidatus Poribacteria bacterium]